VTGDVRPGEARNGCVGDQDRFSDSARVSDAEFSAKLERRLTDPLPIVRYDAKAGERSLDVMRWGLVPYWAKDIKVGFSTINAMAETVETKPVFRDAFRRRRCIMPVDAFYEWKKLAPKEKQPYVIALADCHAARGSLGELALAGRRENPQLHDRHHYAERTLRRASQPHARGAEARGVVGLARRGSGRYAASEGPAPPSRCITGCALASARANMCRPRCPAPAPICRSRSWSISPGGAGTEPSGLAATGWGPLYRLYKGSDRWFFLTAQQPGQLARLAMIEGLHGVDQAPASELPALLAVRLAAAPAGAWVARLTAAGLSAQVARDVHENMADPVHIARGLSILRDHPELGRNCNVGRSRLLSADAGSAVRQTWRMQWACRSASCEIQQSHHPTSVTRPALRSCQKSDYRISFRDQTGTGLIKGP
jgi:SOS response associated peptidase (SRAP)/CoA-transferase family III